MINYQIDENEIFTVEFEGCISFDQIMEFINVLRESKEFNNHLKVLYDLSEANLELTPDQVRQISEKGIDATSRFESVMAAFVVSEPKVTAYSMLFSSMNTSYITMRDIFSSQTAAVSWLLGIR